MVKYKKNVYTSVHYMYVYQIYYIGHLYYIYICLASL